MNPLSQEEIKAKIAAELEITHLAAEEQESIMSGLAEALLERATAIIMAKMPEGEFENVDALLEVGQTEEVKNKILELVPDAPQIVDMVVQDGIKEYKELVEKEKGGEDVPQAVEEPQASTPAPEPDPVVQENFVVDENGDAMPDISIPKPDQPAY